jgi:hypothetical protein
VSVAQPLLGYNQSRSVFFSQFAYLSGVGYVAAGISVTGGSPSPAVRFATVVNGLATASNIAIPSDDTQLVSCFALGGLFIVGDTLGGIWSSQNGETWVQANNVGMNAPSGSPNGGVYDDLHNTIVLITNTNNVIVATPSSGALDFVSHPWGTDADKLVAIGYRPSSGIINVITGSGGTTHGDTYQSVNGGVTWAETNANIFGSLINSFEIAYTGTDGNSIWTAFGGDTSGLLCNSHANDGNSWTAPSAWGGPTIGGVITLDNVGNTVYWTNAGTMWKSVTAGQTWTEIPPSNFPPNDGNAATGLTWDGTLWAVNLLSPDDSTSFFATSPDLNTWTKGPNIVS